MLDTNLKSLRHFSSYNKLLFISPVILFLLFIVSIVSLSNGAVTTSYQDLFNYVLSFFISTNEIDPIKEKVIPVYLSYVMNSYSVIFQKV